ncbi:MAG TPA: bifunctional (p)ppGpp synthetase/guanosine-3',5'-bis(diphosphate) 3'-pyrophosphohydrolase [Candidatus Polarisedimenticolia bacterium]|nr:bifunctional (p)ppGpp synthetase/guanosine-3',5'-bis(diphosphate) 3'-pyrophosphohydrolase [Candidatus Polarisedimenticolia bacterium]
MIRIEDIQEKVEEYLPGADLELLRRAYVFSAMEHRGQVRSSGEPYLSHPLEVAFILAGLRLDLTCVVAGLLHDVIEDTLTTREVLEEYFGGDIAHLVEGLSKISRIAFNSREEAQAENFRKMMLAMVDDIRVILVKLADRLHNMRTLEHLSTGQQERIARETMEIYAPIANRLGMGKIKTELEDLAIRYLDPTGYASLVSALEERRKTSEGFIAEIRQILETKVKEQGISCEITGRVKHFYSIYKKLQVQGIDVSQVYDYVAFRILTSSVRDCYGALGIIHSLWRPVPGRIKDFIAMPKPNMYQSLHTSVMTEKGQPFEVQIRTAEMHRIAEEGIAAHWKYKEGRSVPGTEDPNVQWLRQIMEWQQELKDPREFLKMVKVDLYPEEVYAFTPQGQVKSFPRGATPVDFAYSVHTEVGHRCVGARINGKFVPLKTLLSNGDIVEILTSPAHKPSQDWLTFVKTSRARSKIHQWLKVDRRHQSVELGKSLVEREMKKYRLNLKALGGDGKLSEALQALGCASLEDLYAAVGYGKVSPREWVARLAPAGDLKEQPESRITRVVKRALGLSSAVVKVRGLDEVMVYLAKCCGPIRGEPIVGYITRGKGVSVHAERCPNVERLLYDPERRIDVAWAGAHDARFEVQLTIFSEDRQGVLARVTSAIADEKSNIKDVRAQTFEGKKGQISLTLDIADLNHLERILQRLRGIQGVHHVERQTG